MAEKPEVKSVRRRANEVRPGSATDAARLPTQQDAVDCFYDPLGTLADRASSPWCLPRCYATVDRKMR